MTIRYRRRWVTSSRGLLPALGLLFVLGVSWFLPAALWAGDCGMKGCVSCCCCCQAPDATTMKDRTPPTCCEASDAEGQAPPATEAEAPQRLAGDVAGLARGGDSLGSVTDACRVIPDWRNGGLSPPSLYLRHCSFLI